MEIIALLTTSLGYSKEIFTSNLPVCALQSFCQIRTNDDDKEIVCANFDSFNDLKAMGNFKTLFLNDIVKYDQKLCPYLFEKLNMQNFKAATLMNHFIKRNLFEKLVVPLIYSKLDDCSCIVL